jgi:hypothetical protein
MKKEILSEEEPEVRSEKEWLRSAVACQNWSLNQ